MLKILTGFFFKRILLWFWALWWAVAFVTDLTGGLNQLGITDITWANTGNYPFLYSSLMKFFPLPWLPAFFYVVIIGALLLATLLFFRAAFTSRLNKEAWLQNLHAAFIFTLIIWLGFLLGDQVIMNFVEEENHAAQAGFELLTYFAIFLLPDL